MRAILASAGALICALAWLADPLSAAAGPAAGVSGTARVAGAAGARALPVTRITVNTGGGDRVYDGVGAVLGGGGNARYLEDYPARQRDQILDYLFKPGYGAALQILKLEIGGDANSSDGSEPSVEHARGHVSCQAGYEFTIARQAVARNPDLILYGLQWTAPGWVRSGNQTSFTGLDIDYLISWLGCARRAGLTIGYLGGWNEADTGTHRAWFAELRKALNHRGFRRVRIAAADSNGTSGWEYVGDPDVAVLGSHNPCGSPTGVSGPLTTCNSPWSMRGRRLASTQPMWASELGGMDANARPGCVRPCASAMDRAVVRGYVDARITGFLEWPVLDAMPPGLPFENRGLVTADQPWSGSYRVNDMTWAIAQLTQFASPQAPGSRIEWQYLNSGSGLLSGRAADGSYVSLVRTAPVRGGRRRTAAAWSTIIEATTAQRAQRAEFHVTGSTGGGALAGRVVHVRASDFAPGRSGPRFIRLASIRPTRGGRFSLVIQPGWVYSLTTTTGQGKGAARGRAARPFPLPLRESLASSGAAGRGDDEPPYLAAQDGAFELAPCAVPDGGDRTCTQQDGVATPIFWHNRYGAAGTHFPYATIGDQSWMNYQVSADVLLTRAGTTAGLIGRFSCRGNVPDVGQFDGYVFDVGSSGAWRLIRNANPDTDRKSSGCAPGPGTTQLLASGTLDQPPGTGHWHRLSLSLAGPMISAAVDGHTVATVSDASWAAGPAGLEAGAFTESWPRVQYSHLTVTRLPAPPRY
jgi:Glycosyl hydrolase family 59